MDSKKVSIGLVSEVAPDATTPKHSSVASRMLPDLSRTPIPSHIFLSLNCGNVSPSHYSLKSWSLSYFRYCEKTP